MENEPKTVTIVKTSYNIITAMYIGLFIFNVSTDLFWVFSNQRMELWQVVLRTCCLVISGIVLSTAAPFKEEKSITIELK